MYFIGLTFHQNFVQFKKIDSFRKRFDSHYPLCKILQMTILPPFELNSPRDEKTVLDSLEEELESFFHGVNAPIKINFDGLDISSGPKKMISLRPTIPSDLRFAQETISDILSHYEVRYKRKGNTFYDCFLPVGRTLVNDQLHFAINQAREEFTFPLGLFASSITLFQKCSKHWPAVKRVYQFNSDIHEIRPDELIFSQEGAPC